MDEERAVADRGWMDELRKVGCTAADLILTLHAVPTDAEGRASTMDA